VLTGSVVPPPTVRLSDAGAAASVALQKPRHSAICSTQRPSGHCHYHAYFASGNDNPAKEQTDAVAKKQRKKKKKRRRTSTGSVNGHPSYKLHKCGGWQLPSAQRSNGNTQEPGSDLQFDSAGALAPSRFKHVPFQHLDKYSQHTTSRARTNISSERKHKQRTDRL
jgi:hypothetical protein